MIPCVPLALAMLTFTTTLPRESLTSLSGGRKYNESGQWVTTS
ncbi:hypothetical protein SAMN05414139_07013 [Burkholderia sp. D7]|nr:hypothetical protein SAMN05414139_07013 [Burkholderia sp. D7]